MSFGFGFWLNWLFEENKYGRISTNRAKPHSHSLIDNIFHSSDKMPKHVEMVRTKCQPKIGTDKMPTTIKSPDKMPTFGWHFVRLAFCPVGILSAHHLLSVSDKLSTVHWSTFSSICQQFEKKVFKNILKKYLSVTRLDVM